MKNPPLVLVFIIFLGVVLSRLIEISIAEDAR